MHRYVIAIAFALAGAHAFSQAVDGVIAPDEYAFSQTKNGITVGARLSADGKTLYVGVRAKTAGWVGIGLGSPKMDGAFMLFGYVTASGQTATEQTGKGHTHSVNPSTIATIKMTESDGFTTLEAALPAGSLVRSGKLDLIAAFGIRDDDRSLHAGRAVYQASF